MSKGTDFGQNPAVVKILLVSFREGLRIMGRHVSTATTRKKDGKVHRYWSIVENRRLAGGRVLQRHVLYLGEINDQQERAWRRSIEVLDDAGERQSLALFADGSTATDLDDAEVVRLQLSRLRLCNPRQWGAVWLTWQLWEQLGLEAFWSERLPQSRKGTRWVQALFVLAAYRLIAPGSKWRLHRHWYDHTALGDLLGTDASVADPHKLYACHDRLLAHKQDLFTHLTGRWQDLFGVSFEVLLYDLTSTHFVSIPPDDDNDKRRYGYSRDHRSDCVQVEEGFKNLKHLHRFHRLLPASHVDQPTT